MRMRTRGSWRLELREERLSWLVGWERQLGQRRSQEWAPLAPRPSRCLVPWLDLLVLAARSVSRWEASLSSQIRRRAPRRGLIPKQLRLRAQSSPSQGFQSKRTPQSCPTPPRRANKVHHSSIRYSAWIFLASKVKQRPNQLRLRSSPSHSNPPNRHSF
jgi:hypothetical protein